MQVAEELGITFQQVQKYENGSNRVSPGKLFLLSQYFEVPITNFFDEDNVTDEYKTDYLDDEDLKILNLFKSIKNPQIRKKIIELCKTLNDLDTEFR